MFDVVWWFVEHLGCFYSVLGCGSVAGVIYYSYGAACCVFGFWGLVAYAEVGYLVVVYEF